MDFVDDWHKSTERSADMGGIGCTLLSHQATSHELTVRFEGDTPWCTFWIGTL
ncbi:hypothetical protein [Mycobacterium sp. URHB0021]